MRDKRRDSIWAHMLPARLCYWAAMRVMSHAALTRYNAVPAAEVKALEALAYWYDTKIARVEPATTPRALPAAPAWGALGEQHSPTADEPEVVTPPPVLETPVLTRPLR